MPKKVHSLGVLSQLYMDETIIESIKEVEEEPPEKLDRSLREESHS